MKQHEEEGIKRRVRRLWLVAAPLQPNPLSHFWRAGIGANSHPKIVQGKELGISPLINEISPWVKSHKSWILMRKMAVRKTEVFEVNSHTAASTARSDTSLPGGAARCLLAWLAGLPACLPQLPARSIDLPICLANQMINP